MAQKLRLLLTTTTATKAIASLGYEHTSETRIGKLVKFPVRIGISVI